MTAPVVATALLVERLALRGPLAPTRVVATGMGAGQVRRHRSRLQGPLLTAGLAGGVAAGVRPGDIVVADEVVLPHGRRIAIPSAPALAQAVRRRGLTVHVGPVAATQGVTTGPAREALARQGILAVDMESGAFAEIADGRPFAVVRAVVDTADHPLLRLGTVLRGTRALRNLRRAAPALLEWTQAVGNRDVVLAAPRSFCAGVERA
ncbi:MAG: 4-hydroxy-3-methylbut-2-en-yl diphosphate reductase, partial [Frankiales bacterium]|nr:4-hydroxy-3-methylbut-2-en-yl diphosphate reductase [Frankiales bacterium]